jgi:hypothetical protein
VGICLVTGVIRVTGFTQVEIKNQTNLIINETDNNDPQNAPKNNSINPQKLVTVVTPVT